ncbi:MAG TPA: glycosyltransferase family 39 protein [Candidatus Binatia bacterium]|jgi:4-amino-4-deoxy-L-arabinose transferase-like glycosyltransferase|nr:glycosyltransferase family 39 protein [Candidatus Binatia bacterium]
MTARDLALLAVVLALLLAWPLASPSIITRGEAREALVVQDLVQGGDWVLPRRLGDLASKPPLFHWIGAAGARVLGLSDATVRLPSALAAWVMAAATFALGARIGGRFVGWLAVGVLLAMVGFWRSALEARVDMVFAAAVTVSLAGFWDWHETGGRRARAVCWLAAAAAALAKGPVGFALPGLVVAATLLVNRDRARARALWSWSLAAIALGIVGLWYAAAVARGGQEFIAIQLMRENVDRLVGRGEFAERGTRGRLVWALITRLAPWSAIVPVAAVQWWRGRREVAAGRFLHAWWLVVLGLFTLAVGQRIVYLLPLYPAIAVLVARELAPWFGSRAAEAMLVLALADVAVLGGVQVARVVEWRSSPWPEFIRTFRRTVPADAVVSATLGVAEDARLVLAWRLGRRLPRTSFDCRGYYLRPVPSRVDARSTQILAATPGVVLVKCAT